MVYYCRYIPRMVHLLLLLIFICFGGIDHGFNDATAKKVIENSPLELHNEVIWQPKQSWTAILGYYTWNPIPWSQVHGYSRKLLAFNEYSVSPSPTLSKVLPTMVSLPTTSPPQSPTSTKEGTNPTLRVYPPLPSHAPYYGNSYVAHSYDRVRSLPWTIPIIAYAPDQSPKQAKVPSLESLDHSYLKSPVVISPAHVPTSSAESSLMPLPLPLPNPECENVCMPPYTKTPLGSPCGCVIPIRVELELDVALYALFPQISVLSGEIAESTLLSQNQVRIAGAKSDKRDQSKSIVTIELVPLGKHFDNISVLLIFQRFWKHDISLNATLFGNYTVHFVHYPGLPLPPSQSGRGGLGEQPFAVNVKRKRSEMNKATIALIALSSVIAVAILLMALWLMILKFNNCIKQPPIMAPTNTPAVTKKTDSVLSSEIASSTTMSFVSSMGHHTGSAKSFTLAELERATERFKPQNVVGEGGSGCVYRGVLDDGVEVAVKVFTREDQQGGKRFFSEVEMLSRLHHRNLVKLLGICTEGHSRCLVYELVMNGSVESHLHGVDKERSPLDWDARMKIALGAARGLAYIHEDSNPGVVHRDFKAANILLEDDFTPKISDFGLAKDVSDEPSSHFSTRVMGTFGYIAPEYVMTGHLLVKSDVYSYGVVLLELLTGRKPVDLSQPPGQENLVTWARPLLASKEGLEPLVDPTLRDGFPWESMTRVAAITSMCVQPEVSHRPFMGEVVQALKLVCNDSDASNDITSANASLIGESPSHENITPMYVHENVSSVIYVDYESNPINASDSPKDRSLSASAVLSSPRRLLRQFSGSFRRHSTLGSSLYKVRGSDRGSMSERTLRRPFGTGFEQDIYGLGS